MPKSIKGVMNEYKSGTLHSGSSTGKVVTNPRQAIAIALSENRAQHPIRNLKHFAHPPKKGR
jgi:hypothetical protein